MPNLLCHFLQKTAGTRNLIQFWLLSTDQALFIERLERGKEIEDDEITSKNGFENKGTDNKYLSEPGQIAQVGEERDAAKPDTSSKKREATAKTKSVEKILAQSF